MSNLDLELQTQLIETCHMLHEKGMVSGSGGNVSIRAGERVWITPTGVSLRAVTKENLVALNMDGTWEGMICPSKEYRLHLQCYVNRPEISSVVHVHSLYSVALSCAIGPEDQIPVYFPGYAMRVGKLPVLPYMRPGDQKLAEAVSSVISRRNSVLLANHGVVTVGRDIQEALNIMEEIEENAQLYFILGGKGHEMREQDVSILYAGQ